MANEVKIKYSSTPGAVPVAGSLTLGQIAINVIDRRLYYFDGTAIQVFELAPAPAVKNIAVVATLGVFYKVVVPDAAVSAASNILLGWGQYADTDANAPDNTINLIAIPGAGSFTLIMESANGQKFGGNFKFNYIIT